jgi:hypothetical protein
MPAILDERAADDWMNPNEVQLKDLKKLLSSTPEDKLFDLDETLLDSSGLQESIVQTCKVIAASKSGLEDRDLVEANKKIWPDYFREAEHKWKLGALDAHLSASKNGDVRFACAGATTSHSLTSRCGHFEAWRRSSV